MKQKLLSLVTTLSLLCSVNLHGQTDTAPMHVATREVLLDIEVVDKKGNPVSGLKKEDFTVLEDGVEQQVRSFEAPQQHKLEPKLEIRSTADLAKAPNAAVNILVLDEFNTRFQDSDYVRYSVKKYLTLHKELLDVPTMLIAVSEQKFQILHDYTQDSKALYTAVNKHLTDFPWNLQNTAGSWDRLALTIGALDQVAEATRGHEGRKNILWIGRGFPGVSFLDMPDEQAQRLQTVIQRVVEVMRESRITLYTIDPTPMTSQIVSLSDSVNPSTAEAGPVEDPFEKGAGFSQLAPATGGRALGGRNDIDAELGHSMEEADSYYTMSYSPSNKDDSQQQYRSIKVRLADPSLRAITRKGYYTKRPTDSSIPESEQQRFDLLTASLNNMSYTGVGVQVAAMEENQASLVVNPKTLEWVEKEDGGQAVRISVLATCFGSKNRVLARIRETLTMSSTEDRLDQALTKPLRFAVKLEIPPSALRVRFVVRDENSGRVGTTDFVVPPAQ